MLQFFLLLHEDSTNSKASFFFFLLKCATFTITLFTVDSLYNQVCCSFISSAYFLDDAYKMLHSSIYTSHIIHPVACDNGCGNINNHVGGPLKGEFGSMVRSLMYLRLVNVLELQTLLSQEFFGETHTGLKKKKIHFCQL